MGVRRRAPLAWREGRPSMGMRGKEVEGPPLGGGKQWSGDGLVQSLALCPQESTTLINSCLWHGHSNGQQTAKSNFWSSKGFSNVNNLKGREGENDLKMLSGRRGWHILKNCWEGVLRGRERRRYISQSFVMHIKLVHPPCREVLKAGDPDYSSGQGWHLQAFESRAVIPIPWGGEGMVRYHKVIM